MLSHSQWPSDQFASKVAEEVGYKWEGEVVSYEKYVKANMNFNLNDSVMPNVRIKRKINTMRQRYIKVSLMYLSYIVCWKGIIDSILTVYSESGQGVLQGNVCPKN